MVVADYDNSGRVGQSDLALVLANWGQAVADGEAPTLLWGNMLSVTAPIVGQDELALVLQHWGDTTAILSQLNAITAVTGLDEQQVLQLIPEPTGAGVLLATLLFARRCRGA